MSRWARISRWPTGVRRTVAVVLVLNVALGLAFSVIGLRRQADGHTRVDVTVARSAAVANHALADVWQSVVTGQPSEDFADVDLTALERWPDHRSAANARRFIADVRTVRAELDRGDTAAARQTAQHADDQLTTVRNQLQSTSAQRVRAAADAGQTADIETIVLMLFAAAMGIVLFRRMVAVRRSGDRKAAEERARAEERFASLVRQSSDLISIVEVDFTVRYQTPSVRTVLGYEPGELVGTTLLDLVHVEDRVHLVAAHDSLLDGSEPEPTTVRMRAAGGSWRHIESVHTDMRDDATVAGIVVTSRDVTERIGLAEQLRHSALHDELTGLANRALFTDRVDHALGRRSSEPPVVVFLDLDDFKSVNDTLGHRAGDDLLVVVAARLSSVVRTGDTVARFGGDEFAVLIEDLDVAGQTDLVQRMQDVLREPVVLEGRELVVSASLGVARGGAGLDTAAVLANADLAMYAAKADGKDATRDFVTEMGEQAVLRLQIKTELQAALRAGQICAQFQPTFDLATNQIDGFEALARWEHPERGVISPADFIPLAEQTGQIVAIGRVILRQACQALAGWHREYPQHAELTVAVNLSARELLEPDLITAVTEVLRETGLAAQHLTLEVTETLFLTDPEKASEQLGILRQLGIQIAIDDFGTGYSSLSYLENLPVDIVKIDKSFIDRLVGDQPNVIVETITSLGAALGLRSVAEGIEHDVQADVLRRLGCDIGQGFLFSRPINAANVAVLLQSQTALTPIGIVDADDTLIA